MVLLRSHNSLTLLYSILLTLTPLILHFLFYPTLH